VKTLASLLAATAAILIPAFTQDFDGKQLNIALKMKGLKPAPRLADGHPDLGNAAGSWIAPGVGDMAGHGGGFAGKYPPEKKVDVKFLPWAKAEYDRRNDNITKDDPEGFCLPPGIPRLLATSFPFQIYQLPNRILFVHEGGAHMWRVVYMDGRKHTPADQLNPTFLGESIGRWEGDTLVVDVTGQNDRAWLDAAGHPKTEQLHVVERYTRVNELIMHYEAAIEDPGAYGETWKTSWNMRFYPGMEPLEYICQENNADMKHMVGK
jgi:hypothetical protein